MNEWKRKQLCKNTKTKSVCWLRIVVIVWCWMNTWKVWMPGVPDVVALGPDCGAGVRLDGVGALEWEDGGVTARRSPLTNGNNEEYTVEKG